MGVFREKKIGQDIMENSKEVPQKIKLELPYVPRIPLLGI